MKYKYVYVAGPYEKPDPVVNTRNTILVASILSSHGFVPFVPHLTLLWHMVAPQPVDFWYKYDNEWLKKCDVLLRLGGESKGADAEVELAYKLGIPVFWSLNDLLEIVDESDSDNNQ